MDTRITFSRNSFRQFQVVCWESESINYNKVVSVAKESHKMVLYRKYMKRLHPGMKMVFISCLEN